MGTTRRTTGTSKGRRTAYIVVAIILAVAAGVAGFGLLSLIGPWFDLGDRAVHRVHDLGWGALAGLIVTFGLVAQFRPERAVAPFQAVLGALTGILLATLLSGAWGFVALPLVLGGILIALHPQRGKVLGAGPRIDASLAVIAVVAAFPLVAYALDQAAIQRGCPPVDAHCEEFHWASMAALGFGLPLAGLAAAAGGPGRRLAAWLTGLAAVVLGLSSALFPELPSSVGRAWGAVAIAGGALFVALAEWRSRGQRLRATERPGPARLDRPSRSGPGMPTVHQEE